MEDAPKFVPSTPDPEISTMVFSLLRWLLAGLSGAGLVEGSKIGDSTLMILASALVGIGTAAWAIYDKVRRKRLDHEGSVASARAARPLQVR